MMILKESIWGQTEDSLEKIENPVGLLQSLPRNCFNCAHSIGAHLTNTMQIQQLLWATSSSGFTIEKIILLLENCFFWGPSRVKWRTFLSFLSEAVFNIFASAWPLLPKPSPFLQPSLAHHVPWPSFPCSVAGQHMIWGAAPKPGCWIVFSTSPAASGVPSHV